MSEVSAPGPAEGTRRARRGYLDWMRGLAVLIMIEAHVVDSWTRAADRDSWKYGWSTILGGFGAPLFLFLAGLSVVLSASAKFRKSGDRDAAWAAVMRRGFQIFVLAFVFRVQAWVLGMAPPWTLLRVDILNIMGPAIMVTAAMWGMARTTRGRYFTFALAALAMTFFTPIVRATALLAALPDPIEAYIRPIKGLTNFVFFPWAGFVFGGAVIGLAIDGVRTAASEARLNTRLFLTGAALAAGACVASFLPSPYPRSDFWTSSPAFFLLRTGLMTAAIGAAYAWESWVKLPRWSPMQQLGRTSLFVYWIHVEMVYGLITLPIHRALSLGQAWMAFAAFCVLMLVCSIAKSRAVEWWRWRRTIAPAEAGAASQSG